MLGRLSRSHLRRQALPFKSVHVRAFSDGPDVDIDNFKGEWKTFGEIENYKPGKFSIQTFNKISPKGLKRFEEDSYNVTPTGEGDCGNAHAILLRSHKLQEEEVMPTVRAIAR